jgi:hypothetical protein
MKKREEYTEQYLHTQHYYAAPSLRPLSERSMSSLL